MILERVDEIAIGITLQYLSLAILALGMSILIGVLYIQIGQRLRQRATPQQARNPEENLGASTRAEASLEKLRALASGGDMRDGILEAYRLLRSDLLGAYGVVKDSSATEREIVQALGAKLSDRPQITKGFLAAYEIYEKARFGNQSVSRVDLEKCLSLIEELYRYLPLELQRGLP